MAWCRVRVSVLLTLVAIVFISVAAAAQTTSSTTGAINGRVTDKTNAVLPGVTVTISSPAMMGTRNTVTAEDGSYRFAAVPPGDHAVVFELAWFTTLKARPE